nr:uncharacterized protein LOC107437060 [Parasteatoda tepidariorum]
MKVISAIPPYNRPMQKTSTIDDMFEATESSCLICAIPPCNGPVHNTLTINGIFEATESNCMVSAIPSSNILEQNTSTINDVIEATESSCMVSAFPLYNRPIQNTSTIKDIFEATESISMVSAISPCNKSMQNTSTNNIFEGESNSIISAIPPCNRLVQNTSTINDVIEVTDSSCKKQPSLMNSEVFELESLKRLSNDFSKIFEQSINTDFTFCVDGNDLKVHKTILRARSPVFDRMLNHITGELFDLSNSIDITDIRLPAMKRFVNYLYSGTYRRASFDETCDLYYVADKYEVLTLRDSCRRELLNILQVSNACSLLKLANHHSDDVLKNEVMKFIETHFKSIVETESWEELVNNHTKLAATVMRICARALSV